MALQLVVALRGPRSVPVVNLLGLVVRVLGAMLVFVTFGHVAFDWPWTAAAFDILSSVAGAVTLAVKVASAIIYRRIARHGRRQRAPEADVSSELLVQVTPNSTPLLKITSASSPPSPPSGGVFKNPLTISPHPSSLPGTRFHPPQTVQVKTAFQV